MNTHLSTLEQELRDARSATERVDALNALAELHVATKPQKAYELGNEALNLAQSIEYQAGIGESLVLLSQYSIAITDYPGAIQHANDAMLIFDVLDDWQGQLKCSMQVADVASRTSDFTRLFEIALETLNHGQTLDNDSYRTLGYFWIAKFHEYTEELEKSIENYQLSILYARKIGDIHREAMALGNMSSQHRKLGKYELALEQALKSHEMLKDARPLNVAVSLGLIGNIYHDLQEYEKALSYYKKKLAIAEEYNSDYIKTHTLDHIGRLNFALGEIDEALEALHTVINICKKLGDKKRLLKNYRTIVDIYKAMRDYEKALIYHEYCVEVKDELFNEEADQRRKLLMIQHETEQAQLEADFQKQRAEQAEQRAGQDQQYFEQLNRMKDEFIASATHDLKNPLATILLNVHLLRQKIDNSHERHLTRIEKQAQHMNMLIADMLDLAKLETGYAIELAEASMTALINDLVNEYRVLAGDKDIMINLQFDAGMDDLSFCFDAANMYRALSNLLSNAIKYSPEGSQVMIKSGSSDGKVLIEITDTGFGIPEAELPEIFNRFYRVDSAKTANIEGTGLGLSIVKLIIEQHEGAISVMSLEGQGTTFIIELPDRKIS